MNREKRESLLCAIDWTRPELAELLKSGDQARALLDHLAGQPRGRYFFEYERKLEMKAFLKSNYPSWQKFDTAPADRVRTRTIAEAQGFRALTDVGELGKAWLATGDPSYGAAFEKFYTAVPTGEMFNFGSFNGKQPTYELASWFLLLDCPGFTSEGRIAFLDHLRSISDEAWDIHTSIWRQIDLGTEGHNWYLHGAQVLPFFVLFPEFKRSQFFVRSGAGIFEEHLRGHYKQDGGARETTLEYQLGSMVEMWSFYCVMHRNGVPLSARFADRLLHATRFLLDLTSPIGGLPSFGDSGHTPGALAFLAAMAAALTGDGTCKWYAERCRGFMKRSPAGVDPAGVLPEPVFWRVGLAGAAAYEAAVAVNPHLVSVLKGDTGYAALRKDDTPEANYMAIAAAARGPIVTSHGHNDVFSLEIHAGGVRLVGEMGCASYGESLARQYDEMTEAHTCLTVDNLEQAPLAGEWRWHGHVLPAVRRWISEPSHDFFHGVHEGFYRYRERHIVHARKVLFIKGAPSYWLVFDWLDMLGEHDVAAYFHGCVPGMLRDNTIVLNGDAGKRRLAIFPPCNDAHVRAGQVQSEGLSAYIADRKLKAEDYPCYAFRAHMGEGCLVWAVVPHNSDAELPKVERIAARINGLSDQPRLVTALEIRFAGCTDTVCLSHAEYDAELAFAERSAWGIMDFSRRDAAGVETISFRHTVRDGACGH